jgi:hypothetical protein
MEQRSFAPGFRLSAFDAVILVAGTALSVGVSSVDPWIGIAIAFVVVHFFVFCNVLRMARKLELIWTGLFVLLSAATIVLSVSWPTVLTISLAGSSLLALAEMLKPSYHGVGWKRINPALPEWWATQNEPVS